MNGIFGMLLVIFNFWLIRRNHEKGIFLYTVLLMVVPVSHIWGVAVDYEILSFPIVLYLLAVRFRAGKITAEPEHFFWLVWYIWLLATTAMSDVVGVEGNSVAWLSVIGLLRCFFIYLFLYREQAVQKQFTGIVRAVILINAVAIILQYALSVIISPTWVLLTRARLYGTVGNSGTLMESISLGQLDRFFGTFASSAFVGTLAIVGLYLFWNEFRKNASFLNFVTIVSALLLGVAASSKRFYLGLVALGAYDFFTKHIVIGRRTEKLKTTALVRIFAAVTAAFGAAFVFFHFFKDLVTGNYYLSFLLEGRFLDAFRTRFGVAGAVSPMRKIIGRYPFTGVGNVSMSGIMATDSQLYLTLFMSGVIGLLLMLVFFFFLFRRVIKERNLYKYLIFAVVVFEFVISTEFYSAMGIFFIAYLSGIRGGDFHE